jgi:hypothetical protein
MIIDMQQEPDLKISQSIRSAALPEEIFNDLSPRGCITCCVDRKDASSREG